MNVLVLTTSFPTKKLPVGMHVFNKCKYLVKKGIQITVIAPHYPGEELREKKEGINVIRFPYFWPLKFQKVAYDHGGIVQNINESLLAKIQLPLFMFMFFLYGLVHSKNKNIIHAHWFPAGLVGVIIKYFFDNKLVLMMHHPQKPNLIFEFVLRHTDYLLANSSYVLKRTEKIHPVKNKHLIPIPIDYNRFKPESNTDYIRDKINIPEDAIFVLSVTRFIKWKGIEYLIRAIAILIHNEKRKNIYLRIAGQGPLEEKYEKEIKKLDIENYVELIGYIKNTEIHNYYNEADIFVIPTIIDDNGETEGFGVVTLEANACETPVIASKVGGIIDVIEDGYNGFFVEQKNPKQIAARIKQLADNQKLRYRIGKNGRSRVTKEFNWDNVTDEIIQIYNELI